MANYNGQLNSNEIFSSIYNMIISQEVRNPALKDNFGLANMFRTDGSLYGDTKLFYDVDVLPTYAFGGDSDTNVLALARPEDPACQAITIDTFRQVAVTVDNYLTKRAWATEGAFSQFNSLMVGMLSKAKEIHEATLVNAYVGTVETGADVNTVTVTVTTAAGDSTEEKARIKAQTIATEIANLKDAMADYSRDYNENGFLRAFGETDIIWNAKFVNEITKLDLPTIFHKEVFDGMDKKIPARYFGQAIDNATKLAAISDATPAAGKPINATTGAYTPGVNHANGTVRSLVEKDVTVSSVAYHILPGDELPAGATVGESKQFVLGEFYMEDAKIIAKVLTKDAIKFMSAFETGTEFFNPKSLTQNHYLTFGYSAPKYLKGEAIVTVKLA